MPWTDVLTSLPSSLRKHFGLTDAELQVHRPGWTGLFRPSNGSGDEGWFGFGYTGSPVAIPCRGWQPYLNIMRYGCEHS